MTGKVANQARREDAEMAIAFLRAELNRLLEYRTRYDTEGHNLCLAIVDLKNGDSTVLAAYSNDSAIPAAIRLHLNLVPDLYALMPHAARFGCDGMAQLHTEPKLLNFLTATPEMRERAYAFAPPGKPARTEAQGFYRAVLDAQRERTAATARLTPPTAAISAVTLVSEIACCMTCVAYSINRFRERFPDTPLETIELGKKAGQPTPYQHVRVKIGP